MAQLVESILGESKHITHTELEVWGRLSIARSIGSTLEKGEDSIRRRETSIFRNNTKLSLQNDFL